MEHAESRMELISSLNIKIYSMYGRYQRTHGDGMYPFGFGEYISPGDVIPASSSHGPDNR